MPPTNQRIAAVLLGAVTLFLTCLSGVSAGLGTPGAPPYNDPAAVGVIGLCSKTGQPIRGGSIDEKPFAWFAVSSLPTPASYQVIGRTAQLYAYSPLPQLGPPSWPGEPMTAPSTYTDSAYPKAAATLDDLSLREYLRDNGAGANSFIQLRMYLRAPGRAPEQPQYASADIQITPSDTWSLVRGGNVPCDRGAAVSAEVSPAASVPTTTAQGSPKLKTSRSGAGMTAEGYARYGVPALLLLAVVLRLRRSGRRPSAS